MGKAGRLWDFMVSVRNSGVAPLMVWSGTRNSGVASLMVFWRTTKKHVFYVVLLFCAPPHKPENTKAPAAPPHTQHSGHQAPRARGRSPFRTRGAGAHTHTHTHTRRPTAAKSTQRRPRECQCPRSHKGAAPPAAQGGHARSPDQGGHPPGQPPRPSLTPSPSPPRLVPSKSTPHTMGTIPNPSIPHHEVQGSTRQTMNSHKIQ